MKIIYMINQLTNQLINESAQNLETLKHSNSETHTRTNGQRPKGDKHKTQNKK